MACSVLCCYYHVLVCTLSKLKTFMEGFQSLSPPPPPPPSSTALEQFFLQLVLQQKCETRCKKIYASVTAP